MGNIFLTDTCELTELSIILRLVLSVLISGIIGMEREHKRRPAGFRTHILVCLGATLTSLTGQYICTSYGFDFGISAADPLRISAQVIAGIGFIGAGAIIVTKRSQVKGLTTAAGLWATAIVGIAIGTGFYLAVGYALLLILAAEMFFSRLEIFLAAKTRNVNLYIEYKEPSNISQILALVRNMNADVIDMEVAKVKNTDEPRLSVILSIHFKGKSMYEEITTELARVNYIYSVQEL